MHRNAEPWSIGVIILSVTLIMVLLFLCAYWTWDIVSKQHVEYERQEILKSKWFTQHECKHTGYTARERIIYTCNDGISRIWRDIPTGE